MSEKQRHSRSYHRYFEDYAEVERLDEQGRSRMERIYVGCYYRASVPDETWKRRKILYPAGWCFSAAALLFCGLTARISAEWFVAIPLTGSMIFWLLSLLPVLSRIAAPREMKVRSWRDLNQVGLRYLLGGAVCFLACALAIAVSSCILPDYSFSETAFSALLCLLAGCCALFMFLAEKGTAYEKLPPRAQRPPLSSPIRYESPL